MRCRVSEMTQIWECLSLINSIKRENSWTFNCTTFTRLDDSPIFTVYTGHIYSIQSHKARVSNKYLFRNCTEFQTFYNRSNESKLHLTGNKGQSKHRDCKKFQNLLSFLRISKNVTGIAMYCTYSIILRRILATVFTVQKQ